IEQFIRSDTYFTKTRISSLYSDFNRLKILNPDGYEANLNAWLHLFLSLLESRSLMKYEESVQTSLSMPTRNPNLDQLLALPVLGKPRSLGLVLKELVERKQLIPVSEYKAYDKSFEQYFGSQGSLVDYVSPTKWLSWGLMSLGLLNEFTPMLKDGTLKADYYFSWEKFVSVADGLFKKLKEHVHDGSYSSLVYDKLELLEVIQSNIDSQITPFDLDLLLIYYSRDKKHLLILKVEDRIYIKFNSIQFGNAVDISEADIGISNLKSNIAQLEKRNDQLSRELDDKIPQSVQSLISKPDSLERIKKILINKKTISKSLSKSQDIVNQLNSILLKIDDATLNSQILQIYKTSIKTLSSLNKVDLDEVENIKSDLDDEIRNVDEVSNRLNEDNAYDDEIEEEYER
ncbi:hypothetical protein HYPBUDRAFT_93288, partial [Hyphopichia burtonii NRRL Y-1933]